MEETVNPTRDKSNWEDALREIRSQEFDINLNVLSGTEPFLKALRNEPATIQALRCLTEQPDLPEKALEVVRELTGEQTDPGYANLNDTPLTALLWLLSQTQPDLAIEAANLIARTPGCFYARKLAGRILQPE